LVFAVALLGTASSAAAEPTELPTNFAYNYGETDTPRAAGMGSALRALGANTTAPFLNPANMGLTRAYRIQAFAQFTPEAARHLYGGAIIDSTRRFSGGAAVVGGFMDEDGLNRSQIDVRVPLAFAISDSFHIGVGGRYLMLDQEGSGPLGDSRLSGGLKDPDDAPDGREALINTVTLDAGMTVVIADAVNISAVGQNITFPDVGPLPTMVGGGVGYGGERLSIEVDAIADFSSYEEVSPRVMAGGEYVIGDVVPVRLGYRFDLLRDVSKKTSHALSGGLGYLDPRFGIEFSVRRTLVGPEATTVVAGFSFHLESLGVPIQDY
jgi:hypothetical protein